MSITDLGYASNNESCDRTVDLVYNKNVCRGNNYLFYGGWTITPTVTSNYVYYVNTWSDIYFGSANAYIAAHPSLFLKPEVKIISGKGTEQEPYRLSM